MKLIVLPGNSLRNKEWADAATLAAREYFSDVYTHYYKHWETGEKFINFSLEVERVQELAKVKEPCAVLAKSIGTVLATHLNFAGKIKIAKALYTGVPLGDKPEQAADLAKWLAPLTVPVTIIQNDADPYSNYAQINDFLTPLNLPNVTLIETHADNHDYLDFNLIQSLIPTFFTP